MRDLVVAVGGGMATGKSTIATRVARHLGAELVRTDALRASASVEQRTVKSPLDEHEMTWAAQCERTTRAIYDELIADARGILTPGRPVVLDGCFARRSQRAAARHLAAEYRAAFLFLECRAAPDVVARRLAERDTRDGLAAGTWMTLCKDLARGYEPTDELVADEHVVVPTDASLEEVLEQYVWPALDAWLEPGSNRASRKAAIGAAGRPLS